MNFVALSGLPRSGSTLLSAILDQNPEIHAEGNSAVCQLMWDAQVSCETNAREQLQANRRQSDQEALVSAIPAIYYRNVNATHIVDKCRSWTLPENIKMLRRYITKNPKIIVLTRPIDEVANSFINLRKNNGWSNPEEGLFDPMSEPIMRSQAGVEYAKATNTGEFLFVTYDDLIENTVEVLERIYEFCGFDAFAHNLDNIENKHPEDDRVYGLIGMHSIRSKIEKVKV